MPRLEGVDTSHHQEDNKPQIDFTASPDIHLWMIKATEGVSFVDPDFAPNRIDMRNAGKRYRGMYHFLISGVSIQAQADHFCSTIQKLDPVGEFWACDSERGSNNLVATEEETYQFKTIVTERFGPRGGTYCGVFTDAGKIWKSTRIFDGSHARLLAAYTTEVNARKLALPYSWDMWQYSSNGPVPGVSGRCDMNQIDNWAIFDKITNQSQKVEFMEKLLTTADGDYVFPDGSKYPAGTAKWRLQEDGSKRHLGLLEYNILIAGPHYETALATGDLNNIPDYHPTGVSQATVTSTIKLS